MSGATSLPMFINADDKLATDIKILVVYVVDIGDKAFPVTLIQATNWSPVFCNLFGFTFTWNHKNVDL